MTLLILTCALTAAVFFASNAASHLHSPCTGQGLAFVRQYAVYAPLQCVIKFLCMPKRYGAREHHTDIIILIGA